MSISVCVCVCVCDSGVWGLQQLLTSQHFAVTGDMQVRVTLEFESKDTKAS